MKDKRHQPPGVNLYSLKSNKHKFGKLYKLLPLIEDYETVVKLVSGSVGDEKAKLYDSAPAGIDITYLS